MPVAPTYPGVYVQEIPSGVHTITGVATSITAFVGRAASGPVNEPIVITSFAEYQRTFGGLSLVSTMSFAVRDFFQNGGGKAVIVRLYRAGSETINSVVAAGAGASPQDVADAMKTAAAEAVKVGDEAEKAAVGGTADDVKKAAAKAAATSAAGATAANAVAVDAAAAAATDANGVTTAMNAKAATFTTEPEKSAAAAVAAAAQNAGKVSGATADSVRKAAAGAAAAAAAGAQLASRVASTATGTKPDEIAKALKAIGAAAKKVADAAGTEAATGTIESVKKAATKAAAESSLSKVKVSANGLNLQASSEGAWANGLQVRIEKDPKDATRFKLLVRDSATGNTEVFLNLSINPADPLNRQVNRVLEQESELVQVSGALPGAVPAAHADPTPPKGIWDDNSPPTFSTVLDADRGDDGSSLQASDFVGADNMTGKRGLYALRKTDLFNLLCIPPYLPSDGIDEPIIDEVAAYCQARRAVYLIDPPPGWTVLKDAGGGRVTGIGSPSSYAAVFFPRLRQPNPLHDNQIESFVPCGAVAGVFARTDAERGVWKAPAGLNATLSGVSDFAVRLTDGENGQLNPLAVNCLRNFPGAGRVVWGARTRDGDDRRASEWKYIPVRRTALFIEESLFRGTQWVVFEPNDEPLWAQIRLNIGAFLQSLFRQGAFQGKTPQEAYFVKCDGTTTTQNDIDRGIVNIVVGFAPLKPAEFVVIRLQQLAGQLEV